MRMTLFLAGVLAAVGILAGGRFEDVGGGAAEFEGRLSGDRLDIGGAPDPVCAKDFFWRRIHIHCTGALVFAAGGADWTITCSGTISCSVTPGGTTIWTRKTPWIPGTSSGRT